VSRELDDKTLAYLWGELDADEHAAVEAELQADPELAREVELFRRIMSGAEELGQEALPSGLDAAIWEAAEAEMTASVPAKAAAPAATEPTWAASLWASLVQAFRQPAWAGAAALVLVGVVSVGLWEMTFVGYETRTEMMDRTQAPAAAAPAPAEGRLAEKAPATVTAAPAPPEVEAKEEPALAARGAKLAPLDPGVLRALSKSGGDAPAVGAVAPGRFATGEAERLGDGGEAAGAGGLKPDRDSSLAFKEMAKVVKKKSADRRLRRRGGKAKRGRDKAPAKTAVGGVDGLAGADLLGGGSGGYASAPSVSSGSLGAGRSSAPREETARKIASVRAKAAKPPASKPKPSTRFAQPPPGPAAQAPAEPEAAAASAAEDAEEADDHRDEAKTQREQEPSWQDEVLALARKGRWSELYSLTGRLLANRPGLADNPDFALYRAEAAVRTGRVAVAQQIAERWLKHPRYETRARSVLGKVHRAKAKKASKKKAPAADTQK
jgi:hypothetical protein